MRQPSLPERLRRRKIVRWAIAYLSVAWLLLQGVDVLAGPFGISTGLQRSITVALAAGFLAALVLAWYHGERGRQRVDAREALLLGIIAAGGGLGVMLAAGDPRLASAGNANAPPSLRSPPALDREAVAVLPFATVDDDTALARLARSLSLTLAATLDGMGGVRTVDPLIVLAASDGGHAPGSDVVGAARRLGAGQVLTGMATRVGTLVRVDAAWHRDFGAQPAARVAVTGDPDDLVALTDSVSLELLRQLWRERPPRFASLGAIRTASVPALRAFLEGEHAMVRGDMPRAVDAFERAFAADSTFWFAYWRSLYPRGWFAGSPQDTTLVRQVLEHRHEFPPQDRLLVEAAAARTLTERLRLLETATARFQTYWPAWYAYAVELVHRGPYLGTTQDQAYAALVHTVDLNPNLSSAWDRLGWIASARRDTAEMYRAVREFRRAASGVEFRQEVRQIAAIYTRLLSPQVAPRDSFSAWVEWIASGPDRLVMDFGVGLAGYGRADVQLALNGALLAREPNSTVASALWQGKALSWVTRGAWDSALVAVDRAADVSPRPPVRVFAYGLAVTGAVLGASTADAAVRRRPVPDADWTPQHRAELAWLDGVLAWVRRDPAALALSRNALAADSAPFIAAFRASLAALAESDDAAAAARALARLEFDNADRFSPPPLASPYPFLVPIHRLVAARWLRDTGADGEAAHLLTWSDAIGRAWPTSVNTTLATYALLDRGEIAEADGQASRARWFFAELLQRMDHPSPALEPAVERARAGLGRLEPPRR